jgi:hypothetical protein
MWLGISGSGDQVGAPDLVGFFSGLLPAVPRRLVWASVLLMLLSAVGGCRSGRFVVGEFAPLSFCDDSWRLKVEVDLDFFVF